MRILMGVVVVVVATLLGVMLGPSVLRVTQTEATFDLVRVAIGLCESPGQCNGNTGSKKPGVVTPQIPWLDDRLRLALKRYKLASEPKAAAAFEDVLDALPRLPRERRDRPPVYILQGDAPASRDEACAWISQIAARMPPKEAACVATTSAEPAAAAPVKDNGDELNVVISDFCQPFSGSGSCIWSMADRGNLTYAIDAKSFSQSAFDDGIDAASKQVLEDFTLAVKDAIAKWESACPECGVKFTYLPFEQYLKYGESDKVNRRFFIIKYEPSLDCGLWAVSFFPYYNDFRFDGRIPLDKPSEQVLRVSDKFMQKHEKWQPQNYCQRDDVPRVEQWAHTLAHELGHILGYQHEQLAQISVADSFKPCSKIYQRAGETSENMEYQQLGRVDPDSIMHSSGCSDPASGSGFRLTGQLSGHDKFLHAQTYRQY